ncbi:MAG: hypothetical protein OXU23_16635, partial [Candidatus Poribacteria bacterium]|nr:hypothetical protein [Candidatus Poribacteria bacterium]
LLHTLRTSEREKELLEFEVKELAAASLQEGEEEELTAEMHVLNNAEELYESANIVYEQLDGQDDFGGTSSGGSGSVLQNLRDSVKTFAKLSEMDASLSELSERIDSSLYELEDIASQIRQYADTV